MTILYWRERHLRAVAQKSTRFEKGLFTVCSVEEFILEQENKHTAQKTERDLRLLERFLETKTGKLKMFQPLS